VVTGTGEAGATVVISTADGVVLGSKVVGSDGTYLVVLDPAQRNGEALVATQRDPAGNVSDPVGLSAPDLTAPPPPGTLAVDDDGTTLTGAGEAGARVEVRDPDGTLLGSGTVAPDGSFTVELAPAQTAGETLMVTQADAAGNVSGPASIDAPFDVQAYDNFRTASIDLEPTTTSVDHGSANYLALVSLGLVNLQAEVLSVNNVRFSVQAGHSLDAEFTYNALLNIGVASGYSVVVQRLEGTQWVAVSGTGPASVLELGLLNGDLRATETFGPGEYRAFLTFDGAAGVGLLGNLNVTGSEADFTANADVTPIAATGNVIRDAGPDGNVDAVTPGTLLTSVTVNGVPIPVLPGGSTINTVWGTLTIAPDGNYSYLPNADPAAIGRTEVFTYTLFDPSSGQIESATLSITIDSPDIAGPPVAMPDTAVAAVTFENVVAIAPSAPTFGFTSQPSGLLQSTGSGNGTFTVAANAEADITITAVRQAGLSVSLLPTYTVTLHNADNSVVRTETVTALASALLGTAASFTFNDLPGGAYTYTVSSSATTLGNFGTTVSLGSATTFLDTYALATRETVTGSLVDNDTTNTPFTTIRINAGAGMVEIDQAPVSFAGQYGTLTVDQTGHYTYQPHETLAYSATDLVDTFTYQFVQPNGVVSVSTLNVTIDVPGDGPALVATTTSLAMAPSGHEGDVIPLDALTHQPGGDAAVAQDVAVSLATYDLFEGQGDLEDVLSNYLSARHDGATVVADTASYSSNSIDLSGSTVTDPFDYLVTVNDHDHDRTVSQHVM
ncbi:BapA/Bap/LapF family large adhesin, partial [Sphingomonas solaris]